MAGGEEPLAPPLPLFGMALDSASDLRFDCPTAFVIHRWLLSEFFWLRVRHFADGAPLFESAAEIHLRRVEKINP